MKKKLRKIISVFTIYLRNTCISVNVKMSCLLNYSAKQSLYLVIVVTNIWGRDLAFDHGREGHDKNMAQVAG